MESKKFFFVGRGSIDSTESKSYGFSFYRPFEGHPMEGVEDDVVEPQGIGATVCFAKTPLGVEGLRGVSAGV